MTSANAMHSVINSSRKRPTGMLRRICCGVENAVLSLCAGVLFRLGYVLGVVTPADLLRELVRH